ncbi:MAG TPA: hypothetical protein VN253_27255 [Kofleriaceae bacterium]|nr:hypothetical protein [Kofleriaceae bacterium]
MLPRRGAVLVVLVALLGPSPGCGGPGPAKPVQPGAGPPAAQPADGAPAPEALPLDRDYPRLAERAVQLYQEVAEAFRVADEDCAAASAKLGGLAAAYADVVAANAKVLHEGRAKELKQALGKYSDQFETAAKSIVQSPAMAKCYRDPAFTKAYDDLVGTPP